MIRALAVLVLLTGAGQAQNHAASTEASARATGEIRLENATPEEITRQIAAAGDRIAPAPGAWENRMQPVAIETGNAPEEIAAAMRADLAKAPAVEHICKKAGDRALGVPDATLSQSGCTWPRYIVAGGRMDAQMTCKGPVGNIRLSLSGAWTRTSFDLTMVQSHDLPDQAGPVSMTVRVSGHRTGECAK